MTSIYLAPTPVRDLEVWFYSLLREKFETSVFILFGYEDEAFTPESHILISYQGYSSNDSESKVLRQGFTFSISYYSHGPAGINPHHDSLAMLEKGRLALWQKIPPRPSNSFPLKLKSERREKPEDCSCKPYYTQTWECTNEVPRVTVVYSDPCQGANEPNSVLQPPVDIITPFNNEWYYAYNPDYDNTLPETTGVNQPWVKDTVTTAWVANPDFDPLLAPQWGNTVVIIKPYFRGLNLVTNPE
jgi:hypothetical protein